MPLPITIQAELRLPAALLQGRDMDAIEQHLQSAGLLPAQAQRRRWRMDAEHPGGYVLMFEMTLVCEETVP